MNRRTLLAAIGAPLVAGLVLAFVLNFSFPKAVAERNGLPVATLVVAKH